MTGRPITGFDVDATGDAAVVVVVQGDGSYRVRTTGVCKVLAAEAGHEPVPYALASDSHDGLRGTANAGRAGRERVS